MPVILQCNWLTRRASQKVSDKKSAPAERRSSALIACVVILCPRHVQPDQRGLGALGEMAMHCIADLGMQTRKVVGLGVDVGAHCTCNKAAVRRCFNHEMDFADDCLLRLVCPRASHGGVLAANEHTRTSVTPGGASIARETVVPLPSNERVCAKVLSDIIALAFSILQYVREILRK